MKLGWVLIPVLWLAGCAQPKPEASTTYPNDPGPSKSSVRLPPPVAAAETPSEPPPARSKPPIVTPDTSRIGKVVKFNASGRFVVLEFPLTAMPPTGTQVFLYRNDLKVGEVKITGPTKAEHTVGDLLSGEAQVGDLVRDR